MKIRIFTPFNYGYVDLKRMFEFDFHVIMFSFFFFVSLFNITLFALSINKKYFDFRFFNFGIGIEWRNK